MTKEEKKRVFSKLKSETFLKSTNWNEIHLYYFRKKNGAWALISRGDPSIEKARMELEVCWSTNEFTWREISELEASCLHYWYEGV